MRYSFSEEDMDEIREIPGTNFDLLVEFYKGMAGVEVLHDKSFQILDDFRCRLKNAQAIGELDRENAIKAMKSSTGLYWDTKLVQVVLELSKQKVLDKINHITAVKTKPRHLKKLLFYDDFIDYNVDKWEHSLILKFEYHMNILLGQLNDLILSVEEILKEVSVLSGLAHQANIYSFDQHSTHRFNPDFNIRFYSPAFLDTVRAHTSEMATKTLELQSNFELLRINQQYKINCNFSTIFPVSFLNYVNSNPLFYQYMIQRANFDTNKYE